MQIPGGINQKYAPKESACELYASCNMKPHEITFDGPKPKKLILASVSIAQPIAIEPYKKRKR